MNLPSFTIQQMLEAGVHFGHTTRRWNPKMKPFIYGARDDIHIIDLSKTAPMLAKALDTVYKVAASGGRILFVGTKRQAAPIVAEAAKRCGQYYVNHRWLGGMLTNWKTVSQSIARLRKIEKQLSNDSKGLTKKEILNFTRERDKLESILGGIKDMGATPDLIFVLDTNIDGISIQEAKRLGVAVVGIIDSNSNPDDVTYPIPGNDDSIRAITFYCDLVADTIITGIQSGMRRKGKDLGESTEVISTN